MGFLDFDVDLQKAKKTEAEVSKLVQRLYGATNIESCNTKDFDLSFIDGGGNEVTVEVKEDMMCMNTGNVCVEYWCRGEPSGIDATKAKFFIYKVHRSPVLREFYLCSTQKLRRMIEEGRFVRKFEDRGDPNSDTCGYLFRVTEWQKFTKLIETQRGPENDNFLRVLQ